MSAYDNAKKWSLELVFHSQTRWETGADLGFLLGGGRRLRGGIFSQLRGRHVPEGRQHLNEGIECAWQSHSLQCCYGPITDERIGWFLNDKKHSNQWPFSALHVMHSGRQNAAVPMIDNLNNNRRPKKTTGGARMIPQGPQCSWWMVYRERNPVWRTSWWVCLVCSSASMSNCSGIWYISRLRSGKLTYICMTLIISQIHSLFKKKR